MQKQNQRAPLYQMIAWKTNTTLKKSHLHETDVLIPLEGWGQLGNYIQGIH